MRPTILGTRSSIENLPRRPLASVFPGKKADSLRRLFPLLFISLLALCLISSPLPSPSLVTQEASQQFTTSSVVSDKPTDTVVPDPVLSALIATRLAELNTKPTKKPKKIQEVDHSPPNTIPIEANLNTFVGRRHACLAAIRQKHYDIFHPLWKDDDSLLLVDPAYHSNVGDHILTLGELQLLSSFHQPPPMQCGYNQAPRHFPRCKQLVTNITNVTDKVALWHAGGNWGDLWHAVHAGRLRSFPFLLENGYKIVSFPQSFYYRRNSTLFKDTTRMKEAIVLGLGLAPKTNKGVNTTILDTSQGQAMAQSRMILTWREEASYQQGIKHYPFASNRLAPDIGLAMGPYAPIRHDPDLQVDFVILLREDMESTVGSDRRSNEYIQSLLDDKGLDFTFRLVDWKTRMKLFHAKNVLFSNSAIQLLSLGKVVICDRLHSSILAYLAGLPFVYIDQVSKKVSGTLHAALNFLPPTGAIQEMPSSNCWNDSEKALWAGADSLADAIDKAVNMLQRLPHDSDT